VNAVQARVMPIIYQDQEWIRLNGRSAGHPPGHAQVRGLQEERETVIKRNVAELNRKLGPSAAAQLQAHIEKEWGPRVTIHQLSGPLMHDPRTDSKPATPYHLEVQQ